MSGHGRMLRAMSRWSPERVRKAAPDDASLRAARALARPGPWSETGATETLLWGKCQGSGSTPYQVSIDLIAPAYRCSCPSRKFPCKHALALLLLWAEGRDVQDVSSPSAFAAEWARERADREAGAAARATAGEGRGPTDPAARAARVEARLATMDAGIEEFSIWLRDLVRSGTAAARSEGVTQFDAAAARLVDAQCPGLANEVRDAPSVLFGGADWSAAAMRAIGRWWTITRAWQRRADLSEDELGDVRTALGWAWSTEEIRARDTVCDTWVVLAVRRVERGRLNEQRTWLRGLTTDETALLLDFAVGEPLPVPQTVGSSVDGALTYYPGSAPRRALFLEPPVPADRTDYPVGGSITEAVQQIIDHRSANPLARRTPVLLEDLHIGTTTVSDSAGRALPMLNPNPRMALAVSGGRPVRCFGEWSSGGFTPLTVVAEDQVVGCG